MKQEEQDLDKLKLPAGTRILLDLPAPWQGLLIPVSEFPVPSSERPLLRDWMVSFHDFVSMALSTPSELLLQLWKLSPSSGTDVLAENVDEWSPEFGLGVWPNRKPPQGWTETSMMDAAAAAMRGDEPEMPAHRLLRLDFPENRHTDAVKKMAGFGTLVMVFASAGIEEVQQSARKRYLPAILDRSYRQEDFYFPLLDSAAVVSASSLEELDARLCGIEVYLRESAEDRALLLLSRRSLNFGMAGDEGLISQPE